MRRVPSPPMRTSVSWLSDLLQPPADAEEQAQVLTRVGFPMDHRETLPDGSVWQEIETTSNRGDCLCHLGLAREIAAATGRTLKAPAAPAVPAEPGPEVARMVPVQVHDPALCPRYTARIIRGVTVGPSPAWMQERLRQIGQVPRNNLVDCTNYVLFELGQPTHVFDLATLKGPEIHVRRARAGERFLPLGEGAQALTLVAEDLVIADRDGPVALAGVKGGAASAVTASTRDVLLESATFDGPLVRAVSRRHRISSDSAYRFQRGVHPAAVDAAAERLAALILECAGGTRVPGFAAAGPPLPAPRRIQLRLRRVDSILGIQVPPERVAAILSSLGLDPRRSGDVMECVVPPERMDLAREIDLVEEVARLHGLDHLPVQETLRIRVAPVQSEVAGLRAVKELLVGAGFVETVSHSLVSERAGRALLGGGTDLLRIDDERAAGEPFLRPSTLSSLLSVRARNRDAGVSPLQLFECASVFHLRGAVHHELPVVGLCMDAGSDASEGLRRVRGVVERLARLLLGHHARIDVADAPDGAGGAGAPLLPLQDSPAILPRAVVRWNGTPVGHLGMLAKAALDAFGLEEPVAAAELHVAPFLPAFPPETVAQELPAFPAIDRDLSILVDDAVPWSEVERVVTEAKPERLESIRFMGTYRGRQTGGRKSVTFRLLFRDPARTMRREEADGAVARAVDALRGTLGAELRA